MKRKFNYIKKILIVIACVCFTLSLAFSVGCNKVNFVDYKDITVKVAYGSNASLLQYVTAVDENGRAYRCSITVKDSEGNPVEVLFDRFNVSSMSGYTAETTIKGYGLKRKITIIVEDRSNIFIEDFSSELVAGFVGEEYTLPDVQISKASGEIITPEYRVYYQNGGTLEELAVENAKFTPEERGIYTLEVSATDAIGQTNSKSADFYVRPPMPYNMFEDFSDELSTSSVLESQAWGPTEKIQYGDGFYTTWHDSFEGRSGIVESLFNTTLENKRVCVAFSYKQDYLANVIEGMSDYDYISIWIWIDKEGNFPIYRNEVEGDWAELGTIKGKEWQEIKIYKKNLTRFAELQSIGGNVGLNREELFFHKTQIPDGEQVKYYLDSISLIKASFSSEQTPTLNQEYSLPELSFEGINGKNIEVESDVSCRLLNSDIVLNVVDGKTTFTLPGKYEIIYDAELDGVNYQYTNYLTIGGNTNSSLYFDDFGMNISTESIKKSSFSYAPGSFYAKWLPSFDGQNGVVETVLNDSSSNSRRFNYQFNKTAEELVQIINNLSDNGYIAVRLWLDLDGEYTIRNCGKWDVFKQKITGQTWQTIKISKQALLSSEFAVRLDDKGNPVNISFAEAFSSSASGNIGFLGINSNDGKLSGKNDAIKIYLDSIYFVEVEVEGDNVVAQKGVEYTLPTCKIVKDMAGNQLDILCEAKISTKNTTYVPQIINGKVVFSLAGEYKISYYYDSAVYFEKDITISERSLTSKVVEDFNEPISVNSIVPSNDMNYYTNTAFYAKWHAEFAGRMGVLETITNNNTDEKRVCGLNNKLLSMATLMDDNDYVSMYIYVDADITFQFVLNKSWGDNYSMPHVKGGEWQEIKISKAMLIAEKSKGERLLTLYAINVQDVQYVVYVDDIRLVEV